MKPTPAQTTLYALTCVAMVVCLAWACFGPSAVAVLPDPPPNAGTPWQGPVSSLDLPDDGHAYHLVLLVGPDWRASPDDRRLVGAFWSHGGLAGLRAQCKFHLVQPGHPDYHQWRKRFPATPTAILETDAAEVVYATNASNPGENPHVLAADVAMALGSCGQCRVFPHRRPAVPDPPVVEVSPQPQPPAAVSPLHREPPLALQVVAFVAGFVGMIAFRIIKEVKAA